MGSVPSFRFDVVTKTKAPAVERHPTTRNVDDFARLAELVKVADKIVEAEAYAPNEGSWECGSCQFAKACAGWHRNANRLAIPMAA
jgi:putative RecB family exonuclease